MRKTATWALVVGCAAMAGTGATRAQDAAPLSTTRGSFVVAAGDKVHGYLRGGETHAIRVHLAKGDVYSFAVNSQKRGDMLLMHLTFLDPSGREINSDARVVHRGNGKKINVGPFKAPATGEYVIELYSQTWFSGDYWATSSMRGARRTVVRLPTDGSTVGVDVAAGSTIQLRSRVASFVIATPGAEAASVGDDDPLVVSLRAGKLASAETGVYRIGAPGTKGAATLEVTRPRWISKTVEAPVLPDDPTRAATFAFFTDGWKEQHDAELAHVQQMAQEMVRQTPALAPPAVVAAPIAVDGATGTSARTATLFLGAEINASGDLSKLFGDPVDDGVVDPPAMPVVPPAPPVNPPQLVDPPAQPVNPPVAQPAPPIVRPPVLGPLGNLATTQLGTPIVNPRAPNLPSVSCVTRLGAPGLFSAAYAEVNGFSYFNQSGAEQRDTPWVRRPAAYPSPVVDSLLPIGTVAKPDNAQQTIDENGVVTRVFSLGAKLAEQSVVTPMGTIRTTVRYTVDGHAVSGLIATGGDTTVEWTVEGEGTTPAGVPFTVSGAWTLVMHGYNVQRTWIGDIVRSPCTLSGHETYVAGGVTESVSVDHLDLLPALRVMTVPIGTVTRTIDAPTVGIHQTVQTKYSVEFLQNPRITTHVKTVTVDPSTPVEGVEDDETYEYLYHC